MEVKSNIECHLTPKIIKNLYMKIELFLPVKDVLVTQSFGRNFLDFYRKLGMIAHNGIDFMAKRGCIIRSAHDGLVTFAGTDGDGGISVTVYNGTAKDGYKTIYYHLLDTKVKQGDKIKVKLIGIDSRSGKLKLSRKVLIDRPNKSDDNS